VGAPPWDNPRVAETIRAAASVIAVRDGERGPEVLVLERSAGSPFLPGYVAFPGGATDDGDRRHALRWFGMADEAPRACAVRELVEEVGLALTGSGLGPAGNDPLASIDAAPPRTGQLPRIAHWIAPEHVPVRFDAQYFAVKAPLGLQPEPDGHEAARAWWARPSDLLEDWSEGRRKLYWPTYFTVRALAEVATPARLLALRMRTREPGPDEIARLPRSTFWQA
jgi:8-oxo-dGTP pyrophosphatase MutT (NUDIX family)